MKYLEITVTTTPEAVDLVSMILLDDGSEGVAIKDANDIRDLQKREVLWDYIDEGLFNFDERVFVTAVFDKSYDITQLKNKLEELRKNSVFPTGSLEININPIDSGDYENEWKKYYTPIEIGGIVVIPEWIEYGGGLKPIFINPGKAFGTGSHETTSLCLELLQQIPLEDKLVSDVGCGSGILGITAVKLGANSVVMTDIDAQAVEAAQYNIHLNKAEDRAFVYQSDLVKERDADILIANITADVLIRLAGEVKMLVRTGGFVLLSGIINSRADEVLSAYHEFNLLDRRIKGEWQALLFKVC